jgi:predicted adenine nucleotide alpha hydrolase (AANH) superfamily ATPase
MRNIQDNNSDMAKLPELLMHCCCAPCASHVVEKLSPDYNITILFYNPNIFPREEYNKREAEFSKLLSSADYPNRVDLLGIDYDSTTFELVITPFHDDSEGGERCEVCFRLRLTKTALLAKSSGFDYFTTTLSVSPRKNAVLLNLIGHELAKTYGVEYLSADFKKQDGFRRSVELSKKYNLYRQNYCGCFVSRCAR